MKEPGELHVVMATRISKRDITKRMVCWYAVREHAEEAAARMTLLFDRMKRDKTAHTAYSVEALPCGADDHESLECMADELMRRAKLAREVRR